MWCCCWTVSLLRSELQLHSPVCRRPAERGAQPQGLRVRSAHWHLHQRGQDSSGWNHHQLAEKGGYTHPSCLTSHSRSWLMVIVEGNWNMNRQHFQTYWEILLDNKFTIRGGEFKERLIIAINGQACLIIGINHKSDTFINPTSLFTVIYLI